MTGEIERESRQRVGDAGSERQQYERRPSALSASAERRLLIWLAKLQPAWVTPNRLTVLGLVGGGLTCAGLALSAHERLWLLMSIFGLFVHWYGDSLDGSVARVRGIERPRFGMFIDQCADLATVGMIALGLALSPFVRSDVALALYAGYLLIAVFVHLRAGVTGIYDIALDRVGPTEGRVVMAALFLAMMLSGPVGVPLIAGLSGFDLALLGMTGWGLLATGVNMLRVAKRLSAEEPPFRKVADGAGR